MNLKVDFSNYWWSKVKLCKHANVLQTQRSGYIIIHTQLSLCVILEVANCCISLHYLSLRLHNLLCWIVDIQSRWLYSNDQSLMCFMAPVFRSPGHGCAWCLLCLNHRMHASCLVVRNLIVFVVSAPDHVLWSLTLLPEPLISRVHVNNIQIACKQGSFSLFVIFSLVFF